MKLKKIQRRIRGIMRLIREEKNIDKNRKCRTWHWGLPTNVEMSRKIRVSKAVAQGRGHKRRSG